MKYARIEWPALVDVSEGRMGWTVIYQGQGGRELDRRVIYQRNTHGLNGWPESDGRMIYQHGMNGQPWVMYHRSGWGGQ